MPFLSVFFIQLHYLPIQIITPIQSTSILHNLHFTSFPLQCVYPSYTFLYPLLISYHFLYHFPIPFKLTVGL
jgi:hypothetical protein